MILSRAIAVKMASLLLQIKAVKWSSREPFIWTGGWRSPVYCDNRLTLLFPEIRTFIKEQFAAIIKEKFSSGELIAGVATGGIAHGAIVAGNLEKPFCYVQSSPNGYGRENRIEGLAFPGQKALVIEDLISTGRSSLSVVETLRESKVEAIGLIAIFTYGFPMTEKKIAEANCPCYTITDYELLLSEALVQGTILPAELSTLRKWREAPEKWEGAT